MPKDPNDKYEIDYEAFMEMEILTPGPVNGFEITPEIMDEIQASYNTRILQAPLVLDHIMQGPAYGHVLSLRIEDQGGGESNLKLIANVGLLIDGLAAVRSGQYPERSVFLLKFHPLDGVWYLNHLALLGAANPAVISLDPIDLSDMTEEEMTQAGFDEVDKNKARICADRMHTWKKVDKWIEYRLRPAYRFETLEEKPIHRYKGIHARSGKLKSRYIAKDDNPERVINQALLFDTSKWDLPTAKTWMGTQKFGIDTMLIPERIAAALEIKGEIMNEINAVWEETDEFIRHSIRPPEDFRDDTFKTVDISEEQGIKSVMGKLKPENVAEGDDADSMIVQNVMFDKTKEWTIEKAKEWVADHPDFKASQNIKKGNQSANAEGGISMPEEKAEVKTVEAGSIPDLERTNADLQASLDKNEAAALEFQTNLNIELRKKNEANRAIIIKAKVGSMIQAGYITPAQINMGLIEALSSIPDEAVVGEDKTPAIDIVINCLKYGGILKLKGEIPKPKVVDKTSSNPDLDVLGSSSVKVTGIDEAARARELVAAGKNPLEALKIAKSEFRGGR